MRSPIHSSSPSPVPSAFGRFERFQEKSREYSELLKGSDIQELLQTRSIDRGAIKDFIKNLTFHSRAGLIGSLTWPLIDIDMPSDKVANLLTGNNKSEMVRGFYRQRNIILHKGLHRINGPSTIHENLHATLFLKILLGRLKNIPVKKLSSLEQSFLVLQYFIESYREYVNVAREIWLAYVIPADWAFYFWDILKGVNPEYTLCECKNCGDITLYTHMGGETKVICNRCKSYHFRFSIDTKISNFSRIEEIPFIHQEKFSGIPDLVSRIRRSFDQIGI